MLYRPELNLVTGNANTKHQLLPSRSAERFSLVEGTAWGYLERPWVNTRRARSFYKENPREGLHSSLKVEKTVKFLCDVQNDANTRRTVDLNPEK
jgi:hypothetical protein